MKKVANAVTVEQLEFITSQVKAIHQGMDFAAPLTPSERLQFKGIRVGASKLQILQNRLVAGTDHKDLLPVGFDLRQFERDVNSAVAAFELLTTLDTLRARVQDTLWVLGRRAFVGGQEVHTHLKAASASAERLQPLVGKVAVRKGRAVPAPSAALEAQAPVQPATPNGAQAVIEPDDPAKQAA